MNSPPRTALRNPSPLPAALRPAWAALQLQWQTQVRPRWIAMAGRERLGLLLAAGAIGVMVVWSIAVAPAVKTLRQTPPTLATLDAQLAQMRQLAAETQALRKQPALPAGQAEAALKSATERLGGAARLSVLGDRATVALTSVEGPALMSWLGEVRGAARAKPIEAQLTRNGIGYSGTVVLSLPIAP